MNAEHGGSSVEQFQPGDEAYVRLAFQHRVAIQDATVVFVHEEDKNAHIMFWVESIDPNEPIPPAMLTSLNFGVRIEKDQKPGVYVLDKINFHTFGGKTLDYQGDVGKPKFEVVPESEAAPVVSELSIFTKQQWDRARRREQQ